MVSRLRLVLVALTCAALVITPTAVWYWANLSHAPGGVKTVPPCACNGTLVAFEVYNATSALGAAFVDGAPQAFAGNGTVALVTGVVGDPGKLTTPFPLLGQVDPNLTDSGAVNRSSEVATLFAGGDTLGIGWNGSAWLITGEARWGNLSTGAAAALRGTTWTNLTPLLLPYFEGNGGVWFDAWNGTAWLLGGESNQGAELVALQDGVVRDLTSVIPNNGPNHWIQSIGWNGTTWLVGGRGVFGALEGTRYTNLLPLSAFSQGGVFAAGWNGSAWLVGGGSPGSVESLRGNTLESGPVLPSNFTLWVDTVAWDGEGWYIGGAGATTAGTRIPELLYWDPSSQTMLDLTSRLPASFYGGQVQFGAVWDSGSSSSILFVGQGGLEPATPQGGPSHGAAAVFTRELQVEPVSTIAQGSSLRSGLPSNPGVPMAVRARGE
ncbi:MAG TPA: hypothetical protein VGV89_10120 [Thermoplasmata archaeon]|nr:hypothetical protein [Thermoplasmata archaeon]